RNRTAAGRRHLFCKRRARHHGSRAAQETGRIPTGRHAGVSDRALGPADVRGGRDGVALRSFLIALVICSAGVSAQTRRAPKTVRPAAGSTKESTSWPLDSVTVEGNHVYSKAQVLAITGLRVGQTVGKPEDRKSTR